MHRLLLLLLLAFHPAPPPAALDQDLGESLRRLASGDSAVRREAERWLAAHLEAKDAPAVARTARAGDAEVRRRLGRALGLADQGLSLSTTFLVDRDPVLAEIGERALTLLITRWSERAWRAGLHEQPLRARMRRLSLESRPQLLRVPIRGDLGSTVLLLAERGRLPLGLTVEPAFTSRLPERGVDEVVGTWDEVVQRVATIYRVGLDGHGFGRATAAAPGAVDDWLTGPVFLRLCAQTDAGRSAVETLMEWCRTFASGSFMDPERRVGAARALAACGWPAAMSWMAERARDYEDPAALEGLLQAALAGRVSPSLQRPAVLQRLRDTAVGDFERGDAGGRGRRILMALRSLHPMGPSGQNLAETLVAGWDAATTTGRWVRLYLLDKMRSPAGAAPARAVLGDPSAPVFLRRQALSTWTAASAGRERVATPELADVEGLVAAATSVTEALELARQLARGGFAVPRDWWSPAGLPAALEFWGRGCVLAWLVMTENADRDTPDGPRADRLAEESLPRARGAAQHWLALLAETAPDGAGTGRRIGELLRALGREHGTLLSAAWRAARAETDRAPSATELRSLDRSLLLADILPRARALELYGTLGDGDAALRAGGTRNVDLPILATVGGWGEEPAAIRARGMLFALLREVLAADHTPERARPLLDALDRVLVGLRRHGWEPSGAPGEARRRTPAELWSREVGRLVSRSGRGGLQAHFEASWPPAPPGAVRDLGRLSRLPRELLGGG